MPRSRDHIDSATADSPSPAAEADSTHPSSAAPAPAARWPSPPALAPSPPARPIRSRQPFGRFDLCIARKLLGDPAGGRRRRVRTRVGEADFIDRDPPVPVVDDFQVSPMTDVTTDIFRLRNPAEAILIDFE